MDDKDLKIKKLEEEIERLKKEGSRLENL